MYGEKVELTSESQHKKKLRSFTSTATSIRKKMDHLIGTQNKKIKRGLLEKFLALVSVVNNEVYQDLKILDQINTN